MGNNGNALRRLVLSREQKDVLRRVAVEKFGTRENFAQALESAAGRRRYGNLYLFSVNYERHLQGQPVTKRFAQIYLDALGDDSRLEFLRPVVGNGVNGLSN
ncbi:hypothetical protein J4233_04930 [Candidatus Pacearchaeota archaeon]|nr:hypothetical protein [Candidatus Pacearchaeota archaeon]